MYSTKFGKLVFGLLIVSMVTVISPVITVVVSAQEQQQKAEPTYDQLKLLLDIMTFTKENYVDDVDTQKLIYSAAAGMLRPLDPFSQFMEPQVYKEMKVETEGKYGGLGIRISLRDNWLVVITPLPGTPAYRLGILPEDKIVKIEDESTYSMSLEDAVNKLRGDPGTNVKITVVREGVKEPIEFTITREVIKIINLSSKMLNKEVGYLHLYEFNANSEEDMKKTLTELKTQGMKSLVLDLRNNPGGLLNMAIEVVNLFLGNKKMIVYTKGRIPQSNREYYSNQSALYQDIPLVVLINPGSASGSEIVAGALQDHKRALIIGMRSFGKASVQTVIPLDKGAGLRLTTAKYYTPAGRLIQRDEKGKTGGIDPDIKIEVTPEIETKLRQQEEKIYPPGKEPVAAKKDEVEDVVLSRAIEYLKVREIFK